MKYKTKKSVINAMKKCKHLWKLGRKSVYPQLDFEKAARFPKMEMRGEQERMCHEGAR